MKDSYLIFHNFDSNFDFLYNNKKNKKNYDFGTVTFSAKICCIWPVYGECFAPLQRPMDYNSVQGWVRSTFRIPNKYMA